MKYLIFITLSIFFISCDSLQKKEVNIESLDVYFIERGVSFPVNVKCGMINKEDNSRVFYSKIESTDILEKFNDILVKLEKNDESNSMDSRIRIIINYKDKSTGELCLGESFDTFLNGENMVDSPELFKLIKEEIKYETTYRTAEEMIGNGTD